MQIQQVVVTGQLAVELQSDQVNTENLGPDEVIVETEYTYISTGTELANYSGQEPKVFEAGQWCTYPWKSGYANVGRVQEVPRGTSQDVHEAPRITQDDLGERERKCDCHASEFIGENEIFAPNTIFVLHD